MKLKAKIFSFVKCSADSMIASVRISRFISETLDVPLVWDESIADEPLDVLIIVNGAYAFAGNTLLAALGTAIESASRVVWGQNDYTIIPPKDESGAVSPFRAAFRTRHAQGMSPVDYWTTIKTMTTPGRAPTGHIIGPESIYVNWNALTFDPTYAPIDDKRASEGNLLYYGAFRKDRARYFTRYFTEPQAPTVISCPNKKFEYFAAPLIKHESRIIGNMSPYLARHGLGLYLEDVKSHSEFHSPANRFYEMLSAGLPMVFQPEATKMMSRAGYDVDDYVVWNANDIPKAMDQRVMIGAEQRDRWRRKAVVEYASLAPLITAHWRKYL